MLPYKIRKAVYGGSKKPNDKTSNDGPTTPLYGEHEDSRIYGGNLQRAVLSDLMDLKSRHVQLRQTEQQQQQQHPSQPGLQFRIFKRAFQQAKFGCIHNRAAPPRIDRGEYAQLIYSCCFYLLNEAMSDTFDPRAAAASSKGEEATTADLNVDSTTFQDAIFAIFALYTLHQTNTLPKSAYTAKETFHHPYMRHEYELQCQWSHLPLGQASEGKIFRRYYASPIRIDRRSYMELMYVRDVCAAMVAKCAYDSIRCTAEGNACECALARDAMEIIDRMMNGDNNFFVYCEYHGPVGLEGLAGNPIFYNAYYGDMETKKNARNKIDKIPITSSVGDIMLTNEKLQSICPKEDDISNALNLPSLSSLLKKHQSNLQSIKTELQSSQHVHHSKGQYRQSISDLQPRQRELVEKTLHGILWPNDEGIASNQSYVDMIDVISNSRESSNNAVGAAAQSNKKPADNVNEPLRPKESLATIDNNNPPTIPISLPISFSSDLAAVIREAFSDFDSMVESIRCDILKDRSKTNELSGMSGANNIDQDVKSVDFSSVAVGSNRFGIQNKSTDVQNHSADEQTSVTDEVSVATGAGKKALAALLCASTRSELPQKKQQQRRKKNSGLNDFWNLDETQFLENEATAEIYTSCLSHGVDEFSVSTGTGRNVLSTLLALSQKDVLSQPKKKRKRRPRRASSTHGSTKKDPILCEESSDDGYSSVSDSSTEVGKLALQSLLDAAQVEGKPMVKRSKRSTGKGDASNPVKRRNNRTRTKKTEPRMNDDDVSEATGGGKRALAELLSALEIKKKVTTGGHCRFEFPGATRSQGKPAQTNFFGGVSLAATQAITVQNSTNGLFQAIEKDGQVGQVSQKVHRSLYKLQGESTVLVVRVVALDEETSWSANDCRARTFGGYDDEGVLDDMNMKSQIDACSYGKLEFVEPEDDSTYPEVVGGVVTVQLNETLYGVSHGTVLGWLRTITPFYAGPLDRYDHVMYFMPPEVVFNGAAAFGYMPGRETWYYDPYSLSTGIQLHELGHNLGMGHSGEDGGGYGDGSGYMGYGGGDVRMCYNAPKNWYLGWYEELHEEYNPLEESSKLFQMVGLSDYQDALASANSSSYTTVLRIETFEEESLYLTYNRKKGVNIDTKEFEDKVTIVRAEGSCQSWVEAGLAAGKRYARAIVRGSGLSVEIVVCDMIAGSPDYALISVHPFGSASLCTPPSPIPSWEAYDGSLYDNLIAHYTFDGNYLDTSGNKFHAFEFGNPTFVSDGVVGQALRFDGLDDYLELPDVHELDFGTSDFTIAFWYRVGGDQNGRPAIIGNKNWRSTSSPGWIVSSNYGYGSNGDDLVINLSNGEKSIVGSVAMDVDFNSWHFVVTRIKRGDKMSLLRSKKGSYALQEDDISSLTGSLSTDDKIRIGTSHGACGEKGFTEMDLDDLGIWLRALSSEEVEQIWMAGRKNGLNLQQANGPFTSSEALTPSAILARYDFENNLLDSTSNHLDSALLNDGGGLSYSSSIKGSFMSLNNADFEEKTFVTLPDSNLLDFDTDQPFTISLWQRTSKDFSNGGTSIISNKDWWSGYNPGWTLGLGADGRLEWNAGDGTDRCDYDGSERTMNDGEWHHVAFSMTRGLDGYVTIYFDGKIVHQKTCKVASLSSIYPIILGTDGRGGAGWRAFFSGDIDKVMIFGSALGHAHMFLLFNQGRSHTAAFAPSISPITAAPTTSPTKRPSASPVTSSPTPGPEGPFYIRNPHSNNLLSINGGFCNAGTSIIPLPNENEDRQKWFINNDGTIESVYCQGMVLDVQSSQCGYSVLVVLSPRSSCSTSQVWLMRDDGVIINSKCGTKAIDIAGGSQIIIWSIHGNFNQRWQFDLATAPPSAKPTDVPSTTSFAPYSASPTVLVPSTGPSRLPTTSQVTDHPTISPTTSSQGPFFITNPNSGKLLNIENGLCNEESNLVLWQNENRNWQKWMLNHDNTIESVHCRGMVVSMTQCSNLASVVLSTAKTGELDGQTWELSKETVGTIINAKCDTKAIDISDGALSDGANIILWDTHGDFNQLWQFVDAATLIPTSMPTIKPTASPISSHSASPTIKSTPAPSPIATTGTDTSAPSPSHTTGSSSKPTWRFVSKTSKLAKTTTKPTSLV